MTVSSTLRTYGGYVSVRGTGSATSDAAERAKHNRKRPAPFRPDADLIRQANELLGLRQRKRQAAPMPTTKRETVHTVGAGLPSAARFVAPPSVRPRIVGPTQTVKLSEPDYPVWDGVERI